MKPTVSCFALLLVCVGLAAGANEAPVLKTLAPFEFAEGRAFSVLQMALIVDDPDNGLTELQWSVLETDFAYVTAMGTQVYFGVIDAAWTGTATVTLVVCDPEGACDQQVLSISVRALNDPPTLQVADQLIQAGESFVPIVLAEIANDSDDELSTLQWEILGNVHLSIDIVDGEVKISPPSTEWTGVEVLRFAVSDPHGASASQQITLARTDGSETVLHRIANAGFVLKSPAGCVALDALFSVRASLDMTSRMRAAEAPFDVDVILVTEDSSYRVSPAIVAANMISNRSAVLVGPESVVQAVLAQEASLGDRCHVATTAPGTREPIALEGYRIEAAGCLADSDTNEYIAGYLLSLDAQQFLCLGDVDADDLLQSSGNPFLDATFDFAFLPLPFFNTDDASSVAAFLADAWAIPSCPAVSRYGCSCEDSVTGWGTVLCFEDDMVEQLLPTK